ncbi:unnamed protein product [Onchocerca flexuosa]|uniref:RNA uridylyltransferase n=1 Tax=Onchocerca flexuosa TaxID=387005 RepID=A0A183HYU7_9BILA|nr:unnamed protein product [Onchocerca flexuosa]
MNKERSKVIAGGAGSSKHTRSAQMRKQKKKNNSDASIISQPNSTENQKISKNINKRKGTPRKRLTTIIPATNNTLVESLIAFENRSTRSEDIFEHMRMQSAVQFRFVTFAASTSADEEHTNTVASSNEPDVISLSDEEESQNDMGCALVEQVSSAYGAHWVLQGDDFTKQLWTSPFIKKEVLKCPSSSNEIEDRRFVDRVAEKIDNANIVKNEETVSFINNSTEKLIVPEIKNDCNRFCRIKQLPEFNESMKSIQNDINVCNGKKQFITKLPLRSGPLVIRKDSFDGLNLFPGMHEFVQNGEIELKIEKPEGKDFIQLILFECCGPLEDPKQVARGGYKICTSAVLHENTSVEIVREALIDLAEQLERISRDSFSPGEYETCLNLGEKLAYCVNKYSLSYLEKQSIYPMKKKSSRFPRAVYYCGLCQFHICSVPQAVVHFLSQEHIDNNEKTESLKKLECLPGPAREQMFKIEQIIRELYLSTRLTDAQYEDGLQIANLLSHFLQNEAHKSYSVMVYGSYLTKLATLHSSLNLALNFPLEYSLGYALSQVMEVLDDTTRRKNFTVHSITSDFQRPDPSIHCTINSVAVVITANCLRQQRATQLINLYCTICSQFKILITTFRSWAELCSLTNVQLGGMPKFAFDIILIHYLQRKGLLPFVFEILNEEEILLLDSENLKFEDQIDKINADFGANNEEWNFGELWIDLFRYYAIEHSVKELIQIRWRKGYLSKGCIRWNKKRFAVEDPFAPDHIMQPQQRIHGYFSSCFLSTYLHFALPRTMVRSLIPYSVVTLETVDVKVKKKRKRKSRKITLLNDSNFSEAAGNNDQQCNRSDSDDTDNLYEDSRGLEANKTQITDVDVSEQKIASVTETGLETSMQIWSNEDENDKNSLVSGKCKDSEKLVSDCDASCLDLNTSHNDLLLLQRDSIDETYCGSNVMSTFQQHNIHFSEISSRMKELELSTASTQNLFVKEEYDVWFSYILEKDESAKIKLASTSVLKIKFHDYDEMSIRKLWLALNNNEYNYPWALQYFTSGLVCSFIL